MKIMLDTNIFDMLLKVDINSLVSNSEYEFCVTSIQIDELCRIPDEEKRSRVMQIISKLQAKLLYTPAVLGVARVGLCVVTETNDVYGNLVKANASNANDATIGSTAKREKCIVVTEDKDFTKRLKAQDIDTISFKDFLQLVKNEE